MIGFTSPTRNRTEVTRLKVLRTDHYSIGPWINVSNSILIFQGSYQATLATSNPLFNNIVAINELQVLLLPLLAFLRLELRLYSFWNYCLCRWTILPWKIGGSCRYCPDFSRLKRSAFAFQSLETIDYGNRRFKSFLACIHYTYARQIKWQGILDLNQVFSFPLRWNSNLTPRKWWVAWESHPVLAV